MLKDKAAANLKAGEALLALGLIDPAASRYYYALYQAAVHALTRQGWSPGALRSGAIEWDQDVVTNNAYLVRRRRSDRDLFRTMRKARTEADYLDDSTDGEALASLVVDVRDVVQEATR